ncbi:MAG: DUF5702 domain-containing protein [Firmicutes bacterium]|nr:DUF5702 domain-containing protein [Bacillota bacterium]
MYKLIHNSKGAVTVFVTLLLIPAILVSGTAVDLARLYTVRSIVGDANQMAANSLLANYDALLQNIYGLFGILSDDPQLADMINDYIEITVFGEDWNNKGLGTFQLFYGSKLEAPQLKFIDEQNLKDPAVLQRQIEEYMKFRGPVIIVQEFLDALNNNTVKEDTKIISNKVDIDADIAELLELYKKLYNSILYADKCKTAIGMGRFSNVSNRLGDIHDRFEQLRDCHESWQKAPVEDKGKYEEHYQAILECIIAYTGGSIETGCKTGANWIYSGWDNSFEPPKWQTGGWSRAINNNVVGLNKTIENSLEDADNFRPNFKEVANIAQEIYELQEQIKQKIAKLEQLLNSANCDEELRRALTEKTGVDHKSQIERYREIGNFYNNVNSLAAPYQNIGEEYIDNIVKPMLLGVEYRDALAMQKRSLSREQLINIDTISGFALSYGVHFQNSEAAYFADFSNVGYKMPDGFTAFAACSMEHKEFFEALKKMINKPPIEPIKLDYTQKDASGEDAEEKQRNLIDDLLRIVDIAYDSLSNNPLGAKRIENTPAVAIAKPNIFNIVTMINEATNNNIMEIIQDPLGRLAKTGDYLLLLTYDTAMFSNYTTTKPQSNKKQLSEIAFTYTASSIPLSPEINYFFQSEWEYLYHGAKNADSNLNAITRLLFLTRLACNYITVFSVPHVNEIIMSIQAAFAWNPPLAIVLGELARGAFVAADTVIDVALLRSGHRVPLIKSAKEWHVGPGGVSKILDMVKNASANSTVSGGEKGLTYANYLLFFFVAKAVFWPGLITATSELVQRTGDLIEWNIINYREDIMADESKMAEALLKTDRFRLANMHTDFALNTTVQLKMLFLSMPLAQKGASGIIPPKTLPISVNDYRGY